MFTRLVHIARKTATPKKASKKRKTSDHLDYDDVDCDEASNEAIYTPEGRGENAAKSSEDPMLEDVEEGLCCTKG